MAKLLLATSNPGKIREYRSLLEGIPFELVTLADEGIGLEVKETGESLEENARLKAVAAALESKYMAIADDSGLEVRILGGEPGRFSARWAGQDASDEGRRAYLLAKLQGVPLEDRSAGFRCVIAIATPGGRVELCSGQCQGLIALEPKGDQGFGYDPLFYLPELGKTMAELPLEVKNKYSHRGRAAREARRILERLSADESVQRGFSE